MLTSRAIQRFLSALEGVKAPATITWYARRLASLESWIGPLPVSRVTIEHLREWRASLTHSDRSAWTLHGYCRAARRLFRWLAAEGHIRASPAHALELPTLPLDPCKGIERCDMLRLLETARGNARDYALILLLADTAARVGGLSGLKVKDVELSAGRAWVLEKGRKTRPVFFGARTRAALEAWLGGRRSGWVFPGPRGPLSPSGIYQVLKRLARRAGVRGRWNPHSFRHGAARAMLARGANLAQVAQILGHKDVSVTVRFYGLFADQELKRAHARYSWVPGEAPGDS